MIQTRLSILMVYLMQQWKTNVLVTQMTNPNGEPAHAIEAFSFEGASLPVVFESTGKVAEGVVCDVYRFDGDDTKDLGIVTIDPGAYTPLQRVHEGEATVEGIIEGNGRLMISRVNGDLEVHTREKVVIFHPGASITIQTRTNTTAPFQVTVHIGDLMQWQNTSGERMIVSEVCTPPYQDGRFENLPGILTMPEYD